jgi:type II secretory pathway pseudopilin PulG
VEIQLTLLGGLRVTEIPVSPASPAQPVDPLTIAMVDALKATRPWVRFLSILGFVCAGLIVLVALGMAAFGVYQMTTGNGQGGFLVGMGALYLLMSVLYIFPSRYLYRYASAIADASDAPSKSAAVERALREQKSFWKFAGIMALVMLVLYIPGVIAAIAIPNLLTAMQRSKQKRSMADIRTIAVAVEAYATDHNAYPAVRTIDDLAPLLEPTYAKALPRVDGWGKPYFYEAQCNPRCVGYYVASAGKDGSLDRPLSEYGTEFVANTQAEEDIVFANGSFVRAPEGTSGSLTGSLH